MAIQTINGRQIRLGSITDDHISNKLSESVLDINWSSSAHAESILSNKTIMDFVQLDSDVTVSSGSNSTVVTLSMDVEADGKGVILNSGLRFRDDKGSALIGSDNKELVAKLVEKVGGDAVGGYNYKLDFFLSDGITPFTFASEKVIQIAYPIRTNLWEAAENFAANERFIDGASDIRSRLNIKQLAKDIFGTYEFNSDGNQSKPKTVQELIDESTKSTDGITTSTEAIDELVTARGAAGTLNERLNVSLNADGTLKADLEEFQHEHGRHDFQIAEDASVIALSTLGGLLDNLIKDSDDLEIYVNGVLQSETFNYSLNIVEGYVNSIDFTPDTIKASSDVVTLKWTVY